VDATEAQEGIEDAVKDARTRKLALLIATLAALLAVVGMQDDNSAQDAVQSNIQASDLWAFFQAKSLRQFTLERQSECSRSLGGVALVFAGLGLFAPTLLPL
jgi:uncharacterized protein DUF4337